MNPYEPSKTDQDSDGDRLSDLVARFGNTITAAILGAYCAFVLFLIVISLALFAANCLAADLQLMAPASLQAVRASLPELEDEDANAKLHSTDVIWYTTTEIPPAFQMRNARGVGRTYFVSTWYNISGDPTDRGKPLHGTWSNEFPWTVGHPGGAHLATSVQSVKGFMFPSPAVAFERTVNGDPDLGSRDIILDWVFAEGTYFVEVLYQRLPGGQDIPFEIRTRIKAASSWDVDVFRPFASADGLVEALRQLDGGKYRDSAITYLTSASVPMPRDRLVDSTHDVKRAFDVTTTVYPLPPIDTQHVMQLLDRPFVSVLGEKFAGEATGPVNETGFANIVPSNYYSAHITSTGTSQDCMLCHDSAGHHGMDFQRTVIFQGRRVRRGAYGHIPGSYSDKINSWHPIDPSSISTNGAIPARTLIRREFARAGLVRLVDRLPEGYQVTE